MSVRIYGLWPIGVDRLRFENRITATAAASTIEEARDIVVSAADQKGFRNPQMWLDPSRTCCEELMEADAIPDGFVALHYTPDWGVSLPRQLRSAASWPKAHRASMPRKGDARYARDEKGRFIKGHRPA
jgi:ABC-type antimicrobial peptide transport system ATPase subunit